MLLKVVRETNLHQGLVGMCLLFVLPWWSLHKVRWRTLFLCWYLSGVLQGCPGSAWVFDCPLELFLEARDETIRMKGRGITWACADDIGIALKSSKYLSYIYPIFQTANLISGLDLKPSNYITISTSEFFSDDTENYIRNWLVASPPEWSNFSVRACAKYLGFQTAPAAGSCQWNDAIKKYLSRSYEIGKTHAPISITSFLYNTYSVSVLLYIVQFVKLPRGFESPLKW